MSMKFYLGLHQPGDAEKIRLPVFVSMARMIGRKAPLKHDDWIMDSGGFSMISTNGRYTVSEQQYLSCIRNHNPALAFCQDWMCEPFMLQKTGLTIHEHQRRTVDSYISLHAQDGRIRPVLQGWHSDDYLRHIEMYDRAGVSLEQLYGVGTVCSRNGDPGTILQILATIKAAAPKMQLHGFGVKTESLSTCAALLASADSMAWSSRGRRTKVCAWCDKQSCANCLEFALLWRRNVLAMVENKKQRLLSYTPQGALIHNFANKEHQPCPN